MPSPHHGLSPLAHARPTLNPARPPKPRRQHSHTRRHFFDFLEARQLLSSVTVQGNGTTIINGENSPSFTNATDFRYASTTAPGALGEVARTYTITNNGATTLDLSGGISIGGTNPGDFSLIAAPPQTSLGVGQSTTFTVQFNPTATGIRSAIVSIANSSSDANPFSFAIDGAGIATTNLQNGLEAAIGQTGDGNATAVNGDLLHVTYSGYLLNGSLFDATELHGGTPLIFRLDDSIGQLFIHNDQTGDTSADFSVITGWEIGLQNMRLGEGRLLIIPSSLAYGPSGTNGIPPNSTLIFEVFLNQIDYSPKMNIFGGNNTAIEPISTTPSTTDGTDFQGAVPAGKTSVTHNFTLYDVSSADDSTGARIDGLTFSGFSITGADPNDFSVAQVAGSPGLWAITFTPTGPGLRTATIHAASNDLGFPDRTFAVQGLSNLAPDLQATIGATPFPTAPIAPGSNTTLNLPLTITNVGNVATPTNATTDIQVFAHNTSTNANTLLTTIPNQTINLAPGAGQLVNIPLSIPANIADGTYALMVLVNSTQTITDSDTANDSATTTQTITVRDVFYNLTGTLTSTSIPTRVASHTPLAGNLALAVNNAGNLVLPKGQQVTIAIIAHNTGTDAETLLLTTPPQSISSLKIGGSQKFNLNIKFAAGLPAGTYDFYARITPVQQLTESSTADDMATTTAAAAPLALAVIDPDISGTLGLSKIPAAIVAGSHASYSGALPVIVANTGNITLPASEHVSITIIAHNTANGSDTVLQPPGNGKYSIGSLRPGLSTTANINVIFPGTTLAAGAYQLEARITPVEPLSESDTDNNLVTVNAANHAVILTAAPAFVDLTGTLGRSSLKSTSTSVTGKINVTIQNLGNVALPPGQQIHLLITAHPAEPPDDSTDIQLAVSLPLSVSNWKPAQSANFSISLAAASPLPGGTYDIEALIVPSPALNESNSANNLLTLNSLAQPLILLSTNPTP